jgi:hypothetical protein
MIDHYNIGALLRDRMQESGFHVFAGQHVRIEFWNEPAHAGISITWEGEVVLTCYSGRFRVEQGTDVVTLGGLKQAVVEAASGMQLVCEVPGMLQVIWAPAYGGPRFHPVSRGLKPPAG